MVTTDAPLTTIGPALSIAARHAMSAGISRAELSRWAGGIHPTQLSQFIHGAVPVRFGDPRLVRLGAALGVNPGDCFTPPALVEARS